MASALSIVQKRFPQVTSVKDSTQNVRIEVSARDVSNSTKKDKQGCAMAVACKRKMHLDGVIIARNKAYLIKGKKAIRFDVPQSVQKEVVSFDRGAAFEPGDYHLTRISPAQRLDRHKTKSKPGKRTSTNRVKHQTVGIRAVLGSKED
jgi:hypothetical protein